MKKIRNKWLIGIGLSLLLLYAAVSGLERLGYGLSYQDSISMPEGWYALSPLQLPLKKDTIVVFAPNAGTEAYLLDHAWLGPHTLLMKHVFAVPGDEVCIKGRIVWINQQPTLKVLSEYAPGELLPQLCFCRKLTVDQYWLMSGRIPNSFDSRYFGPVGLNNILYQATPL